jgi:hypothetical protein
VLDKKQNVVRNVTGKFGINASSRASESDYMENSMRYSENSSNRHSKALLSPRQSP